MADEYDFKEPEKPKATPPATAKPVQPAQSAAKPVAKPAQPMAKKPKADAGEMELQPSREEKPKQVLVPDSEPPTRICPHCGFKFDPPAGRQRCPDCGGIIRTEAHVCKHCGRRLAPPKVAHD